MMKLAINKVGGVLLGLQKEVNRLTVASREGLLTERGNSAQFQGAFAGIVTNVNEMLDAILLPIGEGNRILAQISNGKIDELIAQSYKGDHEKMKQAINTVAVVLQGLQKELARLNDASKEGQLSERGKPDQFQGAYANIVRGVNSILDAVITPLNVAAKYVDQISKGDIPAKITPVYTGYDYERREVEMVSNLYREAEDTIIQCNVRDITERKRSEETVRRSEQELAKRVEELAAIDAEKGQFLAVLAHELRSPLNAIRGWLQILQRPGRSEADLGRGLGVIDRNSKAQIELISDLLDAHRIGTGKASLELRKIDYHRHPLFAFLFVETRTDHQEELRSILQSRLNEFISC